jgi:hypothetical protein
MHVRDDCLLRFTLSCVLTCYQAAGFVTCEQQAGDTWGPAAQPGVRKGILVVTVAAMRQLLSSMASESSGPSGRAAGIADPHAMYRE